MYYIVSTNAYDEPDTTECTTNFNWVISAAPIVCWDVLFSVILVALFIKKLVILVQVTDKMMSDDNNHIDRMLDQPDENTVHSTTTDDMTTTETETAVNPKNVKNMTTRTSTSRSSKTMRRSQQNRNSKIKAKTSIGSNPSNDNHDSDGYSSGEESGKNKTLHGLTQSVTNFHAMTARATMTVEKASFHSDIELIKMISKFTVLVSVTTISTVIFLFGSGYYLPIAGMSVDGVINSICVLYCFKFYQEYYKRYCSFCHWIAFRCCACVLFYQNTGVDHDADKEGDNSPELDIVYQSQDDAKDVTLDNADPSNDHRNGLPSPKGSRTRSPVRSRAGSQNRPQSPLALAFSLSNQAWDTEAGDNDNYLVAALKLEPVNTESIDDNNQNV